MTFICTGTFGFREHLSLQSVDNRWLSSVQENSCWRRLWFLQHPSVTTLVSLGTNQTSLKVRHSNHSATRLLPLSRCMSEW